MNDLIFWRHAEAEDFSPSGLDTDRVLTKRGYQDAAKMAKWLNKRLPSVTLALVSPAQRCQQTAAALLAQRDLEIKIEEFLSINSSPQRIQRELANHSSAETLLVVGHQPNLGILIAQNLGMPESALSVKKGAIWWLRKRGGFGVARYKIHMVMVPD
ncbi:MAG: histidine phosphatase family protein [Methylotenera sp.]